MTLTVRDVLQLEAFQGARVLAGHDGLDRRVERVDVAEVPDLEGWVRGGELMVTCGYAVKDRVEAQVGLVETLARANSAGLVLKVQRYLKHVDPRVLAAADAWHLPLIDLPPWVPFTDVTVPVLASLLAQKTVLLERLITIHRGLTEVVLGGGGMQAIAENLAQAVGGRVVIAGADEQVLAAAGHPPDSGPESSGDPGDVSCSTRVPVILDGEVCGSITVLARDREDRRELYRSAAEHAATVVALELAKKRAVEETEARLQGDLMYDLIRGNFSSVELMVRRARALRWDLTRLEMAMVVNIDAFERAMLADEAPIDEARAQRIKQDLGRIVRRVVEGEAPGAITSALSDGVVVLIGFPPGRRSPVEEARALADRIRAAVDAAMPAVSVSVGIGNPRRELPGLPDSYREALSALRIGRAVHRQPGTYAFADLGIYRLLFDLSQRGALEAFCGEALSPLVEYDLRHKTHLVATLEAFLERNGNLSQTAAHLFVHRNTLAYRLRRVQELLDVDLSRPDVRLELLLACKGRRILTGLGRGERLPF